MGFSTVHKHHIYCKTFQLIVLVLAQNILGGIMSKAVIYARYSSNHQREESIEGQIRECIAYAKRNDITVIDTYVDRALTGKTDARPNFQRMITNSAAKQFDYVIVYTLDRFSRNRYDSATYKAKLKKYGVKVLSAKENITDDPSGILLESLLEGMAEYYSAELAQKVKRGMKENALACRWASGRVPFGYIVDKEKHLQLDPVNAPIVAEIFNLFCSGNSIISIANMLNSRGIRTATGGKWTRSSFHKIFSAEVYIGTFVWSDVRVENAVPAIIPKDLFEKAQVLVRSNKARYHTTGEVMQSEKYILTTKLFCGSCGGNMIGMSGTSKNGAPHYYYTCHNKRRKLTECSNASIRRDLIELSIVNYTINLLKDRQAFDTIVEQTYAIYCKDQENDDTAFQEKRIARLQAQVNNATNAIMNGLYSDAIKEKLMSAEAELEEAKYQLELLKLKHNKFHITKQHIAYFLLNAINKNLEEAKEYILDIMLRQASVQKEKDGTYTVTVLFNYASTSTLPSRKVFQVKESVRNQSHLVVQDKYFTNITYYPFGFAVTFSIAA